MRKTLTLVAGHLTYPNELLLIDSITFNVNVYGAKASERGSKRRRRRSTRARLMCDSAGRVSPMELSRGESYGPGEPASVGGCFGGDVTYSSWASWQFRSPVI